MKENSEKAMELNNELRLNVDQQQYGKTLKVKSDIDDSYEVKKSQLPCKIIGLCV